MHGGIAGATDQIEEGEEELLLNQVGHDPAHLIPVHLNDCPWHPQPARTCDRNPDGVIIVQRHWDRDSAVN